MKKTILFLMVLLASLSLVACQEDAEPSYEYGYGISYGLVHGHYVGVAEVVVDKDDVVVSVKMEEYFLPYNVAKVVVEDVNNIPSDVVTVVGSRGTSYYGKYVSVNGTLFTGAVTGESGSQSIVYSTSGVANIEDWVKVEANAMVYVDAVKAGTVFIANQDGTMSSYAKADSYAKVGWTKSTTGYWTNPASYPLGWGGNMFAFAETVVGTKMDVTGDAIGEIETGATMVDFADYYLLTQQAYQNALAGKM
ncbi:MAG: hypothetical protein CVV58_05065 [Tenericutes bacterium HGW-Tenericutes-3]|nr:MAG: hypothetical protein CVV58_05065 [Tenericutes bacterium HGW-Tenericutes-3]